MTGRRLENLSVLILDDDPLMRSLIKGMLHALDVSHIVEAVDVREARAELDRMVPDVLLCSEALQSSDVLEFIRWFRSREAAATPGLPILLLLDRERTGRLADARISGITEFLLKPVSLRSLHARIRRAMETCQPFVESSDYSGPDRRNESDPDRRREAEGSSRFGVTLSDAEVKTLLGN